MRDLQISPRVTKRTSNRIVLERLTLVGESPVDERRCVSWFDS